MGILEHYVQLQDMAQAVNDIIFYRTPPVNMWKSAARNTSDDYAMISFNSIPQDTAALL